MLIFFIQYNVDNVNSYFTNTKSKLILIWCVLQCSEENVIKYMFNRLNWYLYHYSHITIHNIRYIYRVHPITVNYSTFFPVIVTWTGQLYILHLITFIKMLPPQGYNLYCFTCAHIIIMVMQSCYLLKGRFSDYYHSFIHVYTEVKNAPIYVIRVTNWLLIHHHKHYDMP